MRRVIAVAALIGALLSLAACGNAGKWHNFGGAQASPSASAEASASGVPTETPGSEASPQTPPVLIQLGDKPFPQTTGAGFNSGTTVPKNEYAAAEFVNEFYGAGTNVLANAWGQYFTSHNPLSAPMWLWRVASGGGRAASGCLQEDMISTYPNLFFCPQDQDPAGKVYGVMMIPAATLYQRVWQVHPNAEGNVMAAVVLTHLWGFNLQAAFVAQINAWGQTNGIRLPMPTRADSRLIASCLSGVAMRLVFPTEKLKPDTTNTGVAIANEIGDLPGDEATMPPSEDRKSAFDLGLTKGLVSACGTKYWHPTVWS